MSYCWLLVPFHFIGPLNVWGQLIQGRVKVCEIKWYRSQNIFLSGSSSLLNLLGCEFAPVEIKGWSQNRPLKGKWWDIFIYFIEHCVKRLIDWIDWLNLSKLRWKMVFQLLRSLLLAGFNIRLQQHKSMSQMCLLPLFGLLLAVQ